MPAPAVTREFSITYGAVTIGGDQGQYLLDRNYSFRQDYETASFEGLVVVNATTETDLATAVQTLIAEFRKINQAATIKHGTSTTLKSFSHSSNTGFLSRASVEKDDLDPRNSGRAQVYRVRVAFQLPADASGKSGLRESSIDVTTAATGEREYRVTGTYTASGGSSAKAQYEAQIASVLSTLETDLTGTWERLAHQVTYDDENKVARFTRTGREIIFSQSSAGLNHAAIKNPSLVVSSEASAPGDASDAQRPLRVLVQYEAEIDKAETQDLIGFYNATIKPWLVEHARNVAGGAPAALVRSTPIPDYQRNRIAATLELLVVSGSPILEHRIRTRDDDDKGIVLLPVWDGNPKAKLKFQGPATIIRFVFEDITRLEAAGSGDPGAGAVGGNEGVGGSIGGGDLFAGGQVGGILDSFSSGSGGDLFNAIDPAINGGAGGAEASGYVLRREIKDRDPIRIGLPELAFDVVIHSNVYIMEYVEAPAASGGSGGNSEGSGIGSTIPV